MSSSRIVEASVTVVVEVVGAARVAGEAAGAVVTGPFSLTAT